MDELLVHDPEPCDTCRTGMMFIDSYDGVRRCRRCTDALAVEHGWDQWTIPKAKRKKRGPDENQRTLKGV